MEEKISSGSETIDELLDGGYNKVVTTIYGPAASGKTTLAMLAAIQQAKQGKNLFLLTLKMVFQLRG